MDGVSTLDLVIIQQHILGIADLDSPYKMLASDINNDEKVTAMDLLQLRKMILGVYDNFPENNSWRFVEERHGIHTDEQPWPFSEGAYISDLTADAIGNNFMGIKIGDVNHSVEEKLTRTDVETRSHEDLTISIKDRSVQAGEKIKLTLTAEQSIDIIAWQWTASMDGDKIRYVRHIPEALEVTPEQIALVEGEGDHVTLAWTHLEGVDVPSSSTLMELEFVALKSGKLSEVIDFGSTVTQAVAYNAQLERVDISFQWEEEGIETFAVEQNTPNPFSDHTMIHYSLPESGEVLFSISDAQGRNIINKVMLNEEGMNTITIAREELEGASGVLYYTISTTNHKVTKKMILLR